MSNLYFKPVVIGEENFDLSHLEPFKFDFYSEAVKRRLTIDVKFTNHCFTEAYSPETHVVGEPIFDEHGLRPRAFCRIRYRLSKRLPDIIQSLNDGKVKVEQTSALRNWVYSVFIDEPEGRYHVFFELRLAHGVERQWQDLNLIVESAYLRGMDSPPSVVGKVGFYVLCSKVYLRKPLKTNC